MDGQHNRCRVPYSTSSEILTPGSDSAQASQPFVRELLAGVLSDYQEFPESTKNITADPEVRRDGHRRSSPSTRGLPTSVRNDLNSYR